MSRNSPIPRHPSNRSFIEQMLKWGWEPGKTDGSWQSMFSPPIAERQVRVRVRPATQHDANPTNVFLEVYRLTTNGDGDLFWHGPSEMWLQMLSMERAKAEKRKREEYEASLAKAHRRAEAAAQKQAEKQARTNPPVTIKKEVVVATPLIDNNRTANARIPSKDVLEVLTEHDGPMTVKTIISKMHLEQTELNIRDVANRCGYLVSKGLAERVMQGTYRISNGAKTIDARVQHDGIHRPAEPARPAAAPVARVAESVDDVIEAVLDLLLPQGFKASHLRFIAPWVEATKRMVQEVAQ